MLDTNRRTGRMQGDDRVPHGSGAWLEIDPGVLSDNLRAVLARIGDETEVCVVVKGDAYGHGIDNVLPVIFAHRISSIGVAENWEAALLRARGFEGRVLRVRSAGEREVLESAHLAIEEMVGGYANALAVSEAARKRGVHVKVHVVLNSTGLGREGIAFGSPGAMTDLDALLKLPMLTFVGVASHFATQEIADTEAMLSTFLHEAARVQELVPGHRLELHCGTSFAALSVPEARLDLVRIGGALYGETAAKVPKLRRALSLKSTVVAVNSFPSGSTVGYGHGYRLESDATLASIPLGYAGGYRRAFDNRGECLIRGQRARIVGTIYMNSLVADVTRIPGVAAGDEAVFFGRQDDEIITAGEVETMSQTPFLDLCTIWGIANPRLIAPDSMI